MMPLQASSLTLSLRRPIGRLIGLPGWGRLAETEFLRSALLACVDAGLAGIIFVVPLIMGGRTAFGQLVLVSLSVGIAVCWCLRQALAPRNSWIHSGAEPLLLGAVTLVSLQLVPLPQSLLTVLSPQLKEILPLWRAGALGAWSTLSLSPAATRDGLILLLAFALLFCTTLQRVRRVEDAERLIRWIAFSALLMAVFALVQHFTSNGAFFWFFRHPFSSTDGCVKGAFTNPNHYAHFLALGIGPLVWWVQSAMQQDSRRKRARTHGFGTPSHGREIKVALRALALTLTIFMGLMSLSRGGAMAMFVATAVALFVLYRGSLISRKSFLVLAAAALMVVACLRVYGYASVAGELDDFASVEKLDPQQGRRRLWRAIGTAIGDYPLTGTGLGSHREVCPLYLHDETTAAGKEYTHAENGYLQLGQEAGLPGLLLAVGAIALCAAWCLPGLRRGVPARVAACYAAIAPALAASFLHSLADFVWYVPACMTVVVILAACACRLRQIVRPRPGSPPKSSPIAQNGYLAAALCLAVVGLFMVQNRLRAACAEPCWFRYQRLDKTFSDCDAATRRNRLESMADELCSLLRRQPDHARAHAELAAVHLKLFDFGEDTGVSPLDVRQVRDAALASEFESAEALQAWLARAFGPRRKHLESAFQHARRALTLCPLQGECYLYLADLSFLEGPASPGKAAYVKQALHARPFDGAVLFAAGQEACLAGDTAAALEYWRRSYRLGRVHQERLLRLLASQTPADVFLAAFPSDVATLKLVIKHYEESGPGEDARIAWKHYAAALETRAGTLRGSAAAEDHLAAAGAYMKLENTPSCLACLRSALECDPAHYHSRRALGRCLFRMKQFSRAEKHLSWCLKRRPQDKKLRSEVEAAMDGRLRSHTAAAHSGNHSSIR